jgi:hypothetical protein
MIIPTFTVYFSGGWHGWLDHQPVALSPFLLPLVKPYGRQRTQTSTSSLNVDFCKEAIVHCHNGSWLYMILQSVVVFFVS